MEGKEVRRWGRRCSFSWEWPGKTQLSRKQLREGRGSPPCIPGRVFQAASCCWSEVCDGREVLKNIKSGREAGGRGRESLQRAWQDTSRTFGSQERVLSRVT